MARRREAQQKVLPSLRGRQANFETTPRGVAEHQFFSEWNAVTNLRSALWQESWADRSRNPNSRRAPRGARTRWGRPVVPVHLDQRLLFRFRERLDQLSRHQEL